MQLTMVLLHSRTTVDTVVEAVIDNNASVQKYGDNISEPSLRTQVHVGLSLPQTAYRRSDVCAYTH